MFPRSVVKKRTKRPRNAAVTILATSLLLVWEKSRVEWFRNTATTLPAPHTVALPNTPSNVNIPNVIIAGIQKGGTSTLWDYLVNVVGNDGGAKSVCHALAQPAGDFYVKEAHFFDEKWSKDDSSGNGPDAYAQFFNQSACRGSGDIVLDATPDYFHYPERVHKVYSDARQSVKIILSFREPASREKSWYQHRVREFKRQGKSAPDYIVKDILENDRLRSFGQVMKHTVLKGLSSPRILDYQKKHPDHLTGLYAPVLQRWFQLFDRSNILIVNYDELQTDPASLQRRLLKFLEIPENDHARLVRNKLPKKNRSRKRLKLDMECRDWEQVATSFAPHNVQLSNLLKQYPGPPMESKSFNFVVPPPCP